MKTVQVIFENSIYNYKTCVGDTSSDSSIREHFINKMFPFSLDNDENFQKCVDVIIFENTNLEDLLQAIQVTDSFDHGYSDLLDGWFAVTNTQGIIAYFGDEKDANRFRIDYINRILNS